MMRQDQALELLELHGLAEPEVVRAAYAAACKRNHPDLGGDGTKLALYKEARDLLLQTAQTPRYVTIPCAMCRGSGRVQSINRLGVQTCTVCKGTGDRP